MEFLYVCLFSSGHIKVGRSIDPKSRIAAHADRVACAGIELSDSFVTECTGPAAPREAALIQRCAESASRRFQHEWFDGLEFVAVTQWAEQSARTMFDPTTLDPNGFGRRLRAARAAAGLTQTQVGQGMGIDGEDLNKAAISNWETERNGPSVKQLRLLCERLNVSADHLLGIEVAA